MFSLWDRPQSFPEAHPLRIPVSLRAAPTRSEVILWRLMHLIMIPELSLRYVKLLLHRRPSFFFSCLGWKLTKTLGILLHQLCLGPGDCPHTIHFWSRFLCAFSVVGLEVFCSKIGGVFIFDSGSRTRREFGRRRNGMDR